MLIFKFTNFTITVLFADFSTENWEVLVKNSTNSENTSWDKVEMLILRNCQRLKSDDWN